MAPEVWDRIPWWQRRMYLEGYEWEGLIELSTRPTDPTLVAQEVHRSGGTTITDRKHRVTFGGKPGEMKAFGLREEPLPIKRD